MSASVTIHHYEVQRLPSSSITDRKHPSKDLPKVRRALFGPFDHTEAKRIFDTEMQKQIANQSQKWEFDFVNGVPLSPRGTKGRYEWSVVTPPVVRQLSNRVCEPEDNAHLYNDQQIEAIRNEREREMSVLQPDLRLCTKQNRITDYLVEKKRSCPSSSCANKPAKLAKQPAQKDVAS